jgi:hypothetical protein
MSSKQYPQDMPNTVDNSVTDHDRMYLYLWHEEGDDECKFGERFVRADVEPWDDCLTRVRQSLGVRKDRFDTGLIVVDTIWDISELAEEVNRNRRGGRMDDYVRKFIGHRKGSTGEVHLLEASDMQARVNKWISKQGGELIEAGLSTKQYEVAEEVLDHFDSGNKVVLAELCARFGKTIWSGALALETDTQLTVVASYVKTVFASFADDLTNFQQFSDVVHVDTQDEDYQAQIDDALGAGKQVFAYLSLCKGTRREERIDYLFDSWECDKMLIVDEADFGAHQKGQAEPLIDQLDNIDRVIIMTGTNADRAVTHWPVDQIISVTYPELLMQKRETQANQ